MKKRKFGKAMFDTIKDSLNSEEGNGGSSAFENVMKFPAGHTYTIRLLPNPDNPEDTFFHHYSHGWKSKKTGKYVSTFSLQTFGESDPITDTFWKWIKSNDKVEKEKGKEIRRRENWFVNIYVVDDPANPENNGTVKVLRVGPQLKELIDNALEGDGKEEFGFRIFSLNDEGEFDMSQGANLKIKAEEQGTYTTYKGSNFYNKPVVKLTDEEVDQIFESMHDLKAIYPVKTYAELEEIFKVHYLNEDVVETKTEVSKKVKETDDDDDDMDDIPFEFDNSDKEVDEEEEEDLDDLVKGL